jgi:hypothetical protein
MAKDKAWQTKLSRTIALKDGAVLATLARQWADRA